VSSLWASWTPCYSCWVRDVLTLVFTFYLDKNPGWVPDCLFRKEFRLVLNQSVVPVDLELSPEERSVFPLFAIQGYILYIKFVIDKHCLFDITPICGYMWDLTSWAHIWCVSGFVLKTGCYTIFVLSLSLF